jgi:hypothetical protein
MHGEDGRILLVPLHEQRRCLHDGLDLPKWPEELLQESRINSSRNPGPEQSRRLAIEVRAGIYGGGLKRKDGGRDHELSKSKCRPLPKKRKKK